MTHTETQIHLANLASAAMAAMANAEHSGHTIRAEVIIRTPIGCDMNNCLTGTDIRLSVFGTWQEVREFETALDDALVGTPLRFSMYSLA